MFGGTGTNISQPFYFIGLVELNGNHWEHTDFEDDEEQTDEEQPNPELLKESPK